MHAVGQTDLIMVLCKTLDYKNTHGHIAIKQMGPEIEKRDYDVT